MSQLKYLLVLYHARGVGDRTIAELLHFFPDLSELFAKNANELKNLNVPDKIIACIKKPNWQAVDGDLSWLEGKNHHILTLLDEHYPKLLKQIPDPPAVLFLHGNKSLLSNLQIAIVGSRNPSPIGKQNAYAFAKCFAQNGLVVTSGLATGIDGVAHIGALDALGKTIAVLGTGIDVIYPKSNQQCAEKILQNGLIISEFSPGTKALALNFPRRNRIISGLSLGVLVVEAAIKSGSLITARLALEQGREVFAIPGSIHNPLAKGCHALIKQGAKLVENAMDIVEELGPLIHFNFDDSVEKGHRPGQAQNLDVKEQNLLNCIGFEQTAVDLIIERSQLDSQTVSSLLMQLELKNCVASVPGGYTRIT